MAHFSGGDTEYSKRTSPLLSRFRTYLGALHEGGLSWPVFNFMLLYLDPRAARPEHEQPGPRVPRRSAGRRGDVADVHGRRAVPRGGVFVYRARVEANLFNRNSGHDRLDIGSRVAAGFMEYARGPHLVSDLSARRFRIRSTATRRSARGCRRSARASATPAWPTP